MRHVTTILLAAALAVLPLAAAAVPADESPQQPEHRTVTVATDDGHHFEIHLVEGEGLWVVDLDEGEEVCRLDLQELRQEMVEAAREVQEALAELKEAEFAVQLGGDENVVRFRRGDSEVELDLGAIVQGVGRALASLGEIDAVHHSRVQAAGGDRQEIEQLRAQLDELQRQIEDLEKELREVRRRARH